MAMTSSSFSQSTTPSSSLPTMAQSDPTPCAQTQSQPIDDASRLFHCATAPPSTRNSPSLTRMKRCRYPIRFSKIDHASFTNAIVLISALVTAAMADDGSFTGEWDGQWQANSDGQNNDDARGGWKDDDYTNQANNMSEDTFILYATVAILSTLALLFCLCHPEILIFLCVRIKTCCCGRGRKSSGTAGAVVTNASSEDYVGGIQMEKRQDRESQRELI